MPVFNGERFLEAAVRSVLSQSYESLELVAVDDGSTDGSAAILDRIAGLDGRVRVISQENRGHAGALNTALEHARGEFVAVLDCDDEALPGRLEAQVAALQNDDSLVAIGGNATYIDEDGRVRGKTSFVTDLVEIDGLFEHTCPILHSALMMRRDVATSVGGYRPTLSLALDYDLFLRLAERGRLSNLPQCVAAYRVHPDQTTRTRAEGVAITALVARRSALARRAGGPDPVPWEGGDLEELREQLSVGVTDIDSATARMLVWLAELAAVVDDRESVKMLYSSAQLRAARSGDEELVASVARAASWLHMLPWQRRLRAAITRPARRALGRP